MTTISTCIECERPWGIILERGEMPTDKAQRLAQLELEEEWMERLERNLGPGEIVDLTKLPQAEAEEIVWITESLAAFASEHCNSDMMPESACWCVVEDVDLPAWLLKGRKRRWSYRIDCCTLDIDKFIVKGVKKVEASA
jgi:hypothetical protein